MTASKRRQLTASPGYICDTLNTSTDMNTNKVNTGTTREEIYIYIGRLEWLVKDLSLCLEFNTEPVFSGDDEAREYGDYAERICAYVRATHDEQAMIDCCKINRATLYRFGKPNDEVGRAICKARRYLMMIHDYTLTEIWGVSPDDVENCKYYINSVEGVCRNCSTGELLPRPTESALQPPQTGLPSELDTPEANKYFARAVAVGMMERTDTGGKWKTAVARLGYVCSKIFPQPRPIAALERYFGVTKLSAAITQADIEPKRADVKKWRAEIDSKIFFD